MRNLLYPAFGVEPGRLPGMRETSGTSGNIPKHVFSLLHSPWIREYLIFFREFYSRVTDMVLDNDFRFKNLYCMISRICKAQIFNLLTFSELDY